MADKKYITAGKILFTLFYMMLGFASSQAQSVRINEVLSKNSLHFDDLGNTSDGFELYNYGTSEIDLSGWFVSDDILEPQKWQFTQGHIEAGGYLWIWASGKDITNPLIPRSLISQGDEFRYIIPGSSISNDWVKLNYNDASWLKGVSGFGYGDNDDATQLSRGISSVFLRKKFTVSDTSAVKELILHMDYDDAFVAYINGTEVARAGISGYPPAYSAYASNDHEAQMYQGRKPDEFILENFKDYLKPGENVLCVQGHNVSAGSSDFTLIPFLTAMYSGETNEGTAPAEILELSRQSMHTNFKISADGETLYLYNNSQKLVDSLKVPSLGSDISYGYAYPSDQLILLDEVTPGARNAASGFEGRVESRVEFSNQGGQRSGWFQLSLQGNAPGEEIRYTTDATIPTEMSALYTGPISINTTKVVRARIFKSGYFPSPTESRSYIFDEAHDLPLVSLVTEPDNFFHPQTGMYVLGEGYSGQVPYYGSNIWEDWERPIHFSLYEPDGQPALFLDAGVKIFGGWTRANDQRSLSVFARSDYGYSNFDYPIFPDLSIEKYEAIVLRNSGNDWNNTMLRDGVLTSLMEGSGVDYQAFRPVATYLNGDYWGMYNLREKINEHFLADHHNLDPDEIDLLEFSGNVIEGDNTEYLELIDFVNRNSLVGESNYNYVAQRIDIDNFIKYQLAQIYFNNTDWPGNNIKFWRPKDGKWRWILYDTDFGFGIWNSNDVYNNTLNFATTANGPDWPNPPWSTLLLRKLLANESFKIRFINQFADELNSRFLAENVSSRIDDYAARITQEIPRHLARWNGSLQYWNNQVQGMKSFASARPQQVRSHIKSKFNISAERLLTVNISDNEFGGVRVNSLVINENRWNGYYFHGIPIHIKALPRVGYRFSHWSGSVPGSLKYEADIYLSMSANMTVIPVFESLGDEYIPLVINEINYNSSEEKPSGDWIEIYNPNSYEVDVSDWILKDDDDNHIFYIPDNTKIEGAGFLIIARDIEKFNAVYQNVENIVGNLSFGLSSSGDAVRLFNDQLELQDSVAFFPEYPWPAEANGGGYTLELKQPDYDNSIPENWYGATLYGSPGKHNGSYNSIDESPIAAAPQVFPNPASAGDVVYLSEPIQNGSLELIGMDGSRHTVPESQSSFNVPNISSGMYILAYTDIAGKMVRIKVIVR